MKKVLYSGSYSVEGNNGSVILRDAKNGRRFKFDEGWAAAELRRQIQIPPRGETLSVDRDITVTKPKLQPA